ncbi:DUF596 domain-containing protein [Serratia sp. BIGb0163]|jgi:hypothetical protein|uniref:DUF596 domain-containing protein n=1 Tax=Serratia proteamaculans (strain 568) TaxID=399741 RepID=A8GHP2_SERP5|nr:DUF596 domain-containing protein [Serratia sp. BIGb0163]MCS4268116.1 hypothetical protein [Serratia sp. BIGb0163]
MLYSDDKYKLFSEELEGSSIGTVWSAMRADNFDRETLSYEEKVAYFLELIQLLMKYGKIKLAKHGKLLEGNIEYQVTLYKAAFPKTEEEWKAKNEDIWFYDEDCPGGIVWIHDNGYEDWT